MEIIRSIKRFFQWIFKSFQYSWFLRNDYDWDYGYILKLLRYKLRRTRETISKNKIITDEEITKISNQIIEEEKRIQRFLDDEYNIQIKSDMNIQEKYGETKMVFVDSTVQFLPEWGDKVQYKKDMRIVYEKWEQARQKDFNEIFDLMKKNLQNWWD